MSLEYNANDVDQAHRASDASGANVKAESAGHMVRVVEPPARPRPRVEVHRNTVGDSWDWLWKDMLQRVLPLTAAGIIYARAVDTKREMGYATGGLDGWL